MTDRPQPYTPVLAYNNPAELPTGRSDIPLVVTVNPPAVFVRSGGVWVPVASVEGNIPTPTVVNASEETAGIAEIATQAETNAGADAFRIVTPARLSGRTATEARSGVVEEATTAEVQGGTAGVLYVPASKMKAELDRRIVPQHGFFLGGNGPTVFSGVTVVSNGPTVSADLRGVGGVPPDAKGVVVMVRALAQAGNRDLYIDSADAPDAANNSPRHRSGTIFTSGQYWVPLGITANAGKIKLSVVLNEQNNEVSVWVTGWWR